MESHDILDRIRVAAPCKASWDTMEGDERVRFCGACQKQVYNISAMTSAEATALIQDSGGKLCARLYRRADGTVLTADCPVGVKSVARRRLRRLAACAALLLGGLFSGAASLRTASSAATRGSIPPMPSGPSVTFQDWVDWALISLGLKQRPQLVMGKICRIPSPDANVSADEY
jgi:hypothetical protein